MFSFEKLVAEPVHSRTGFTVSAGASGFQLLKGRLWAEDLVLENPLEYPARDFVAIAAMAAALRWKPGSGGFNVSDALLNVTRVTGVRAADGRVNFACFRQGLERRTRPAADSRERSADHRLRLSRLSVSLGSVEIVDYLGGETRRTIYPVGFQREWQNIEVRQAAGELIEALGDSGLSREDSVFSSVLPDRLWSELLGVAGSR